jgi:MtrB/PioB family decaheme-associated outer membrane protein
MKKYQNGFAARTLVVAVQGALLAMTAVSAAYAEGDTSGTDLTKPAQSIEVGIKNTNNGSYKASEFNGLQKKGITADINLDLRGGSNYESDEVARWRIIGTNLGLETRNLSADYSQQGKFKINFGYDELLRNRSDSYQTPLQGIGSNNLTLPSNWLVPAQLNVNPNKTVAVVPGVNVRTLDPGFINNDAVYRFNNTGNATAVNAPSQPYAPTATQIANMLSAAATDNAAFRNVNIYTKRSKYDLGFGYNFNSNWDFAVSVRQETKNGYKLMSTVSRDTGGDMAVIIPDLIDQRTDQYNMSLDYKGDNAFFHAAYYASMFSNNSNSVTWQNWATGNAMSPVSLGATVATAKGTTFDTMSTGSPDNQFQQLTLNGGYDFSKNTKLVVGTSYARGTQNQTFLTDSTTPVVPQASLNGLVITDSFNAKLTTKATKDLNLAIGYKFDQRDNRTAVNTYQYSDTGEAATVSSLFTGLGVSSGAPAVLAQNANANRPYSKKSDQINLDADYRFKPGQALRVGYDLQNINRYCKGTWIECVDANTTKENTARAELRSTITESLTTKIGYASSKRTVANYNENAFLALVPYANVTPIGATTSAYQYMLANGLTGYGPQLGYSATSGNAAIFFPSNNALANTQYANANRISELIGMRRFNMADRNRNKLRASLNWQANEQLSFQGGLDYNNDDYANSVYGLQSAKSWGLNLDATYAASEDFVTSVFFTHEDQNATSAGNSYTANSNTAFQGAANYTAVSGSSCYSTLQTRNNNNKLDPCNNWSSNKVDKVDTLGFNLKKKGLLQGKLELDGDLIYSRAASDNNVTGGGYVNNPAAVANGAGAAGSIGAYYISATALPTVTTDTVQLKVRGKYAINKAQAVKLSYSYTYMKAVDWAYDGMQTTGGLTGVLPTNEQAPNYTVHTVGATYVYSF